VRVDDGDFPCLCPCADVAQFSRGRDPFVDSEHPSTLLSDSGRDLRFFGFNLARLSVSVRNLDRFGANRAAGGGTEARDPQLGSIHYT
jgi:hypothetical protein